MKKYSLEIVGTGNHKADNMNSKIMVLADEFAEEMALKDWGNRTGFWIPAEDGQGTTLSEEAQDIYNQYYDIYMDRIYTFVNEVIELDSSQTDEEKAIERLGGYVSEDDVDTAYKVLLDAQKEFGDRPADDYVIMWEPMVGRYTVEQLLDEIQ